jgi:hypothetical protein
MTTIVMNTMNAAVTEYDLGLALQSISGDTAGSASGLVTLGGDTDDDAVIDASFLGPVRGDVKKTRFPSIYYAMTGDGEGEGEARVVVRGSDGEDAEYPYRFSIRGMGVSRAVPGLGLRANYFAIGFRNVAGADFRIDRIEPELVQSTSRKVF